MRGKVERVGGGIVGEKLETLRMPYDRRVWELV